MSTAPFRTAAGGRVDRSRTLAFTFGGRTLTGHPGDTLASALLAHGVHQVATSVKLGRPRGIGAAWAEDPTSLVQVEEPFPEPMLLASTVELYDGLVADGVPGQGRLADLPDAARYDARHLHVDLLVVGAGPAGLSAALVAARAGARVALVDEQSEAGGSLLGSTDRIDGRPGTAWVAAVVDELAALPEVTHLQRTTVFGVYDDGSALAVERRTDHLGGEAPAHLSRQRVWRVRARRTVVATGAHERPVVFADNDRPGTMLAHSARTYLHRYGVLAGERAVVLTTNDSAYQVAVELADAGVDVSVVDTRASAPAAWSAACGARGLPVRTGSVVVGTRGVERVSAALVRPRDGGEVEELPCDLLLVSGGWNPAVHLYSQARGRLRFDAALGAFLPAEQLPDLDVVGSAAAAFDLEGCLLGGREVGRAAVAALGLGPLSTGGVPRAPQADPVVDPPVPVSAPDLMWVVPGDDGDPARQFVDVQRDATVADVRRAVGAGLRSPEHVKRYTTIGTAHDQGKTSGVVMSGLLGELVGCGPEDVGTTTFRPPYTPVVFATLAGRDRGSLYDPERTTALHDWHRDRGAVWEDVGQWKRPRYYPRPGEDMEAAVLRECAAVRGGVGILDGSTLGKVDVQGPDAGVLLDRLYTNLMSTLAVGRVRYGVMCGVDGMVLDDGVLLRLAEDRWMVMTTTGGAAKVLDWMEEWLQTEWPDLRVHLASVTEQWAALPVVGPRSRDVVGAVFPGVDVSAEGFGFMTWQETELDGVPVRLARISFSGELAWEVHVSSVHAEEVWRRLLAAGEEHGITPYGTETMHVLRAEKGYPIVGQDTDGTVTPQDLGMEWVVSKKKADFVGKRSFARADDQRPDRKHLVGLLPVDGESVLPEGSQVVDVPVGEDLPAPPVPMLGHVTSSYRSAALGRPFALALLAGGRERVGDVVQLPVGGRLVAAEVTGPVLVDPEGARRDGDGAPAPAPPGPGRAAAPAPTPRHPLGSRADDLTALTGGAVALQPLVAGVVVRADPDGPAARAAAEVLGTPLPVRPGTWAATAARDGGDPGTVVWLGPDEWLVLSDEPRPEALEQRLRAALAPLGGSAVDVSAHRVSLRLTGPHARDVLAAGCSIDTHPSVFGAGAVAQTLLGQAGVVLLSRSDAGDEYELLVRSSFARYLADWLLDAFVEHRHAATEHDQPDDPRPGRRTEGATA
ncbi:sarcosine oxidase subunit gamma family protein [Pseudokineococcus marinus]